MEIKNMNESWHIPRASLTGSSTPASSNSSSKSNSNPSTVSRNFKQNNYSAKNGIPYFNEKQQKTNQEIALYASDARKGNSCRNNIKSQPKRGSRSSQGSNDSTQSASSGSLLLTTANLERFAEIHRQQDATYLDTKNNFLKSNYNANLMVATNQFNSNKDAVISMPPNIHFIKTKDMDTMSVASSTHFTMVNGEGGTLRKTTGICSRGKQVTVLIVSMSLFFLIVILGMVYALEMRAREMPKS